MKITLNWTSIGLFFLVKIRSEKSTREFGFIKKVRLRNYKIRPMPQTYCELEKSKWCCMTVPRKRSISLSHLRTCIVCISWDLKLMKYGRKDASLFYLETLLLASGMKNGSIKNLPPSGTKTDYFPVNYKNRPCLLCDD